MRIRRPTSCGRPTGVLDQNRATGKDAAAEVGGVVTNGPSVANAVARVVEGHGRIDILVNNAGIVRNTPAEETDDDEWRSIFAVNCDGVFRCCREVGRVMLSAGRGVIVNVASMSGLVANRPQPQAAYNASKAAVIMLTRSLAAEWADRGVRVNAVAPGYVATELTLRGLTNPDWKREWLAATPLGRVAEPNEISPAVLYLASDASSYVTGSVLVIDGGYTAV